MFVRTLAYGLVAHLMIGWAFFVLLPQRRRSVQPPSVPVQIHISAKPSAPDKTSVPTSAGKSDGRQASTSGARPARPTTAPTSSTQPHYGDLLPKAANGQIPLPEAQASGDPALLPGHSFKAGSSGTTKQKLVIDASVLSGILDVPLHARRITSGAEAFLRIVRIGEKHMKIMDLHGDPMLRAVIFENLMEPRVRSVILELMEALQENSLPLTLRTLTEVSERFQDEMDFTWMGRRLIIRKSAPPVSRSPFNAIALPDEDAKKAVIRDRLEFERFQRSPAYRSTIRNYVLPPQP